MSPLPPPARPAMPFWAVTLVVGGLCLCLTPRAWAEEPWPSESPGDRALLQRLEQLERHYDRLDAENRWLRERVNQAVLDAPEPDAWRNQWNSQQFGDDPESPTVVGVSTGSTATAGTATAGTATAGTATTDPSTAGLSISQGPSPSKDGKPAAGKVYEIGKDTTFKAQWGRQALSLQTADGAFKLHLGGRLHNDWGWWHADDAVENAPGGVGPLLDGANFRRARLRASGTVYDTVDWFTEYGFESGSPAFFDTFIEVPNLPVLGSFRVGHFREPFSMDSLTSGNFLTFMERSLIHDSLVPFRNTGMMFYNDFADESATWHLGLFRSNSNTVGSDQGDGSYALTGRTTWNPWYEMDGVYALHFGAAFSSRSPPDLNAAGASVASGGLPRTRFATRPEFRINAPNFVDTGVFTTEHVDLVGLEFGFGSGPLLVQAEYTAAMCEDVAGTAGDGYFHGFYAQTSYFLTGEHRPYSRRFGTFGQARPNENFFYRRRSDCDPCTVRGSGAWEVGVRYSWLDLNSGPIAGGQLEDLTFGVNWYLNPHARVMWNYIAMHREPASAAAEGWAGAAAMRFQIDF